MELLSIPISVQYSLKATVNDFIKDRKWIFPAIICSKFPDVSTAIHSITIPQSEATNHLVWIATESSLLSFKDAYHFIYPKANSQHWCKAIWTSFYSTLYVFSPFLLWRLLHNKVPTNEKFQIRGSNIVSRCDLCKKRWNLLSIYFFNVSLLVAFGLG